MQMKGRKGNRKMIRATMFLVLLFFCCLPAIRGTAAETENVSVTEAVQTSDIVVDYSEEIIAVRANENNELYYGFGTSAKPPKTYQRIGTELIAEFQNGETTYEAFYIDLSALPFKQGSVFYAKYAEEGIAASIGLEAREKLKAVNCSSSIFNYCFHIKNFSFMQSLHHS